MTTIVASPRDHRSYIDLNQNELRNATIQNLGADPGSPIDGQIWYRSDTDEVRVRINGVTQTVATGASGIPGTAFNAKGDLLVGTANDSYAALTIGANGTVPVAASGETTGILWRTLTEADITLSATDRLVGRDTAAGGVAEELTVGGGIEFTGSGGIQTGALTGDVTKSAGGTVTAIGAGVIVDADVNAAAGIVVTKLASSATDRLFGRDTAAAGAGEELTVGGGIEFTGSGGIQRSALTGDVTATAGSNTTAIAAGVIVDADVNASAAIAATKLAFTPAQNIAATTVQAAIEEVVTDMTALINSTVEGRKWKDPVDAATTGVLPNTPTYNSGAGTLTAGANAAFPTVDGVTAVANQDYLVKDQASSFQNGIYTLTTLGSGAAPWVLTRRADASTATELQDASVAIEAGTTLGGDIYTQTNQTLADLTAATQTWTKTGDLNTVYAADGTTLTLTGNTFSITNAGVGATQLAAAVAGNGLTGGAGSALAVGAGNGITVNADDVALATSTAGAGLTYTTGVLAVGAGSGISVAADAVAVDTAVVVRKYAQDIGNGALTTFTVTHSLGTRDVTVAVFDNATFEEVQVDVAHTTTSAVTVTFTGITPTASQFRVVVHG